MIQVTPEEFEALGSRNEARLVCYDGARNMIEIEGITFQVDEVQYKIHVLTRLLSSTTIRFTRETRIAIELEIEKLSKANG